MRYPAAVQLVKEELLRLLYPDNIDCLLCGDFLPYTLLCPDCTEKLQDLLLPEDVCPQCGYPLSGGQCSFCQTHTLTVPTRSAWEYRREARQLVHLLKFHRIRAAADVLAQGMAEAAMALPLYGDTVITWVTMPEHRRRERGIDHGYELARCTAKRLGLSCKRLLIRRDSRCEVTQHSLDASLRGSNLQGAFTCKKMHGEHVLLVDDVLTTGHTLSVCADALFKAGCGSVHAVTATRTMDKYEDD